MSNFKGLPALCYNVLYEQGGTLEFSAVFEKVPEGYIAFVEELPGAHTQGTTLEEVRENLKEAISLVMEANGVLSEESIQRRDVLKEQFVAAM